MKDLYHYIYDGEIFQKTSCIWHENAMMDFFRSVLINLGYTPLNEIKKVWQRGNQTVVICLADDFYTCRPFGLDPPLTDMFDRNTVVITDNKVLWPTTYQVIQLPESYFGIYNYQPQQQEWQPERRFNFGVNRLDNKRMILFLELISRTTKPDPRNVGELMYPVLFDLDRDFIKFNCWNWNSSNDSVEAFRANFKHGFEMLPLNLQKLYQKAYDHMASLMPYLNHTFDFDQSQLKAWMNIVIETYSGESVIALSEKTFRALVTPAPWAIYSSRHTVAYLKSLGFDVLKDVFSHAYDSVLENNTGEFGDKFVDFYHLASNIVDQLKSKDFATINQRCQAAATHNQKLLAQMQANWPADFAKWLPGVIEKIK
jgi:hypothetical protein